MAFKKGSKEAKAHMAKVRASKISGVKKKVVKKKVVKKAVAPRKKAVAKKKVNISYLDSWGRYLDSERTALPLGKRISKEGNVYYENRLNHADVKQTKKRGQMLGVQVLTQKPKTEIVTLSKKIATLTHYNDHTNAVLLLAKFLKQRDEISILECISKINGYVGGGALRDLINLRSEILKDLLSIVSKKYNLASSELLNSSY
jgi:hypothetical protein